MHKPSVRIGAATLVIDKAQKEGLVFYDRLFDLCERVLPGCGCDVVVLPERSAVRQSEKQPVDGPVGRRFAELAKRHGLYLLAPLAGGGRRCPLQHPGGLLAAGADRARLPQGAPGAGRGEGHG